MSPILIGMSVALLIFCIGVLVSNGLTGHSQAQRDRRQAAAQRRLNEEWRLLRECQEAAKGELYWLSKQQASFLIIDYDTCKEVGIINYLSLHRYESSAR